MNNRCQLNIRVPKKLKQHVHLVAKVEGLSAEQLMIKALAQYLSVSVEQLEEDYDLDTQAKVHKITKALQKGGRL